MASFIFLCLITLCSIIIPSRVLSLKTLSYGYSTYVLDVAHDTSEIYEFLPHSTLTRLRIFVVHWDYIIAAPCSHDFGFGRSIICGRSITDDAPRLTLPQQMIL